MLVSLVSELEISLQLPRLIEIYTDLVAHLLASDTTKTTHDSSHLDGSIRVRDDGQND